MTERFDVYGPSHKALRNYMGAVLLQLGRLDASDEQEVSRCAGALLGLLDWLESHLGLEERFVHAALAARRKDTLLGKLRHDHEEHARSFSLLREDAQALVTTFADPPNVRAARARQLYLALTRFVADHLLHMATEETEMNLLLWDSFSDAELMQLQAEIMASESLSQLERGISWLLPAITPSERVLLVAGARASMPAQLFQQLTPRLREALGERDYAKLAAALGLPHSA